MAEELWSQTPSGTWRNQFLSNELLEAAYADTRFMPQCTPVEGFGKHMGETVDLYTITGPTEPSSVVLTEGVRIPEDNVTLSSAQLTMQEVGRGVTWTSKWEDLSKYQMPAIVKGRLKNQLAQAQDSRAAAQFKASTVAYVPTGIAAANIDTPTVTTTATVNMNLYHVQRIRDYLYGTLLAPFKDGNTYTAICNFLALRGLKNDPNWQQWKTYGNPEVLSSGEVGQIESIKFIETNHSNALTAVGTGSVLGQCVFFGDEAVAYASAVAPELRMKADREDYDRSLGCAWYGMDGFKLYHPNSNAGECRVVVVTSA